MNTVLGSIDPLSLWPADFVPQLWPQRSRVPALRARPSIRSIIEAVAKQHHMPYEALVSQARRREVVRARQAAMWTVRQMDIWSLPAIGRAFGGRDHTTILHGVRAHEKRLGVGA